MVPSPLPHTQLEQSRVDLRESEGRTRAAELLAEGLRGDLQVAKDQLAEAEGAAEATTRGAAAQSVAARAELEAMGAELRRVREAAAEAAAAAAAAAAEAARREEALEEAVLTAKEQAEAAKAKAAKERRDVSRRITSARVSMVRRLDGEGWEPAEGGGEGGGEGGTYTADGSGGGDGYAYTASVNGGVGGTYAYARREAWEGSLLSRELSQCESRLREAEQGKAYALSRFEAAVAPLTRQLEEETQVWTPPP